MPANPFAALSDPVTEPDNPFAALSDQADQGNPFADLADEPSQFKAIDLGLLAATGPAAIPIAAISALTSPDYLRAAARGASAEGVMAVAEGGARLGGAVLSEVSGMIPGSDRAKLEGRLQELTRLEQQLDPRLPASGDEMSFGETLLPGEQARLDQVRTERQQVLDQLARVSQEGVMGDIAGAIGRGREAVREALPVSPAVQQSIPGQVAQAGGQAVGTLPFYLIPGIGQVVGPATSVAAIYQEGYDDAIRSGVDPTVAHETAMTYLPASGLDVLGDKLIVGRFLKPLVGKPIKVVIDAAIRAASEGATETGQQAFLNYIAAELTKYDPERPLTAELRDTFIVSTIVGGVASGSMQLAGEQQEAAQAVVVAGQVVEQAGQQVTEAQETIQTTAVKSAATTTEALENPEVESLDDLAAKQQAIAAQSKATQQATVQASQQLQQATATLQEASTIEAQATQQLSNLAEIEAISNQLLPALQPPLSQPDTPLGGFQEPVATLGEPAQDVLSVSGEAAPALSLAQPAAVEPVSLVAQEQAGSVNEIPELTSVEQINPVSLQSAQEQGLTEAGAQVDQAAVAQPVQVGPSIPSPQEASVAQPTPELGSVPLEPASAVEGALPGLLEASLLAPTIPEAQASTPVPTTAPRGLIVGSKTERWSDQQIAEARREGRLFSGLDPKLSFAYAVKGAALIEQGVRDFAAWSAEMGKLYATLTAENLKEIFDRAVEMARQIRAGEQVVVPPEIRGALVTANEEPITKAEADQQNASLPPTPDPESIEQAEQEGMQAALASPETDKDKKEIITQVLGQEFTVDGRRMLDAGERQRSRNHARGVFAEAGIAVQWDKDRGIYVLADPTTPNETQGRKLVEILKREFGRPRVAADPLFAVLVNSIRSQDGGMWVSSAFSPGLRNDLFAVAQGEASFYGLMLGALASAKRTLSWVASHVDTVLHKAYSDAFRGQQVGTVLNEVADAIEKESGVNPRDKPAVERNKAKVEKARKKALENVKKRLSTRERRAVDRPIRGKKSLWARIEEAVNAGVFDNASILQDIARANGWEVPTPVQLQRLKEMAEREKALRTTPQQEAVTKEERYRLMREMQTLWSRFSRPITWRTAEGRKNFGAAGAEYLSANMLLKLGFWVKQPVDVMSQVFWHVPTRSLASAAQIARRDRENGRPTRFWQDTGAALADASKNLIGESRNAVVQMKQGIMGRGELRNVEGIVGTINTFDRIRQRADELAAAGDHGKATLMRLFSWIQFSFRLARALDNAQGTFIVGQEMRGRVIEELRSAGRTPEQARAEADTIMGDRTAEMALSIGRAHEILDDLGIEHNQTQLHAAAYELFRARQYERMKSSSLDADQIAQSNEYLRQTVGWNMPERKGLGGAIGGVVRNVGRALEEVGVPLPIGRFGNAIAIGINRALTWTPVGFFPAVFGGQENAWFRTDKDRMQRKMEAATGSALGAIFIGMALAGLIRVWNRGPDDPEERELWEKDGHRPGTVEFIVGDTRIVVPLSTGPLAYLRGPLGGIGVMQDVQDRHRQKHRRMVKEADERGLTTPAREEVDADDLAGALAYGAYQAVLGGRTAGGALRSAVGADTPDSVSQFLKTFAASQTGPFVPLLPAVQEVQRARGVRLNYGRADFADLLLPTFSSEGAKRNFLNDPLIPSLEQSVVQTLTGGAYVVGERDQTKPYRIFSRMDYRPEAISRSQGFEINGEFRPLTDPEWNRAMAVRGDLLKAELEQLNEFDSDEDLEEDVRDIARDVRLDALESVGAQ